MPQNPSNRYPYSEDLQKFFEDVIKQPFENHLPTPAWEAEVRDKDHAYHREVILDQGRTNFDEPFNGLSPEDKVLIYCVYYMPMHLVGSYHILRVCNQVFTTHLTSISNQVVFIDFGSGPLTSGIAFRPSASRLNITYLGVESSQAMRNKAKEIYQYRKSRFNRFELISDYGQVPQLLDRIITEGDKTPIIFNFCYFLASWTINIRGLSDVIVQTVEKYSKHNMCIVYQNPNLPQLHENWESLKARLTGFRSRIDQSSNVEQFGYDRLTDGLTQYINIYYDILCNEWMR